MSSFADYLEKVPDAENFSAGIDTLLFENNNLKKFILSFEDLGDSLENLWKNSRAIERSLNNDWTYEEGKYRRIFSEAFKSLGPNSVVTNLGSQTPNTVKSLCIFAGYRLKKEQPSSWIREPEFLKPKYLETLFSLKKDYIKWLSHPDQKLSEKSVTSYSGPLSGWLSDLSETEIFGISSTYEFLELFQRLSSNQEFIEKDTRGNTMYSSALKKYGEFLKTQDKRALQPTQFSTAELPVSLGSHKISESLLAKPFTILTGASGTGKTKLAESLATYLSNPSGDNSRVIAVGADWTDNRNVLGFVNHLRTNSESGFPTYQTTPVLELLLRARQDPDTPYFLILDEMNLSHVERYFSDFLSVMEQKDGQFDLHSEGPASDQDFRLPVSGDSKTGVPQKLDYPQNLFVIGTVNIDETTYMFSPKVLDRANVIEFKVGRDDLGAFLEKPGAYPETQPAASGVAESFLELAKKTRAHQLELLPDSVRDSVSRHLLTLFDLLRNERFEFAYRTAKEITLFLQVSRELAKEPEPWDNEGWQEDLDTQILQKILPKLHGSIGRIAPLICSLSHYCETGQSDKAPGLRELVNSPFNEEEKAKALFPRSAEKLREMAKTLSSEQFVSFIS